MRQTLCDECGQPITDQDTRVDIHVDDHFIPRFADATRTRLTEMPKSLRLVLELHRDCYLEHFRSLIDKTADV